MYKKSRRSFLESGPTSSIGVSLHSSFRVLARLIVLILPFFAMQTWIRTLTVFKPKKRNRSYFTILSLVYRSPTL